METTNSVYNIKHIKHEQLISFKTGEHFSESALLTDLVSCPSLFIHHEILAPKHRASCAHRHTLRDEMVFVLEGFPTAHLGKETTQLKPGDFIGFPAGSQDMHFIENQTNETVRFLVICSNPNKDETLT